MTHDLRKTRVFSLLLALLLLLFTHSTAQAAFTLTIASIGGQTSVTVFPGGLLTVDVTAERNLSTDYDGTSYRFDGGDLFTCVDTPDNTLGSEGTAEDTEQITIPVPNAPGTYTLEVRAHSQSDCGGEVGETVELTVTVISAATNGDLVPACGLDVILVLDESGSIDAAGAIDEVRTAANAFLEGLKNTGSRIAIIEFNTQARQVFNYTEVNSANLPRLQDYINDVGAAPQGGYNPGEYVDPNYFTNWDDAFAKVEARNTASGVAPLVVFITDGDPTAYNDGADINSSADYPANDPRLVNAIEGANAVKAQGSHILAVGVGDGLSSPESQDRLEMISGPDVYAGVGALNIATTDLILVSDFADLTTALQQIVTELCQSSVTLTKLVDPGTGTYSPGENWQFSASTRFVQPNGTDFSWTLPNTTTNPADVIVGTTDANGVLAFQWDPDGSSGSSSIAITETLLPNYKLESVVCEQTSGSGTINVTHTGNAFSITDISIDAIVTCEVKNKLIEADLTLDKSVNNTTPDAGSNVIFTVDVLNEGPDAGSGITVSDTLPSGYTYVSDDGGDAYNTATSIWKIGNLAFNDTATLKITAQVNASGIYTNYAQIWTANEKDKDSTPGNDSKTEDDDDEVVTTPTPVADLELDKSVDNGTPDFNEEVNFTIAVTNTGPSNATGVTVSDTLPSGYTYVSDDSGGAYNKDSGIWNIGNLAVGARVTLVIKVTVNTAGDYLNYAQIWTTNEKDKDSTPGNDSHNEDDDDTESVKTPQVADLALDKDVNNGTPDVGTNVIFTVDVINEGPDAGTGISVRDILPSGYTYVSDDSGDAYNTATSIWTIGNLAVNQRVRLRITARVNASGIYTNYAQIWTANEIDIDSTPGNNSTNEDDDDIAVTKPTPIADLELDKSINNGTPPVGTPIIFTVVVFNRGPNDATGVTVSDQLPSGYTYVSDDSGGAYNNATGIWTIGNLAVNATVTLKITANVNATGEYINYAQVEFSNEKDPDSTPGDDSDDDDDDDTQGILLFSTIGDTVWLDENKNGIQDNGELGVAGVKVDLYKDDGAFIATVTTNIIGEYIFTGLQAGNYYVEFTAPIDFNFTQYNVNSNSQDTVDSDPLIPWVEVGVTDGDIDAALGGPLTYTIFYTNTDATRDASNLLLSLLVPVGTTFVPESSTLTCAGGNTAEGTLCTLTLPSLPANTSGSATFTVLIGEDEKAVPDQLDLVVKLTHSSPGRTDDINLGLGATNLSIDAGLVRTDATRATPTPTESTNLPGAEQPQQQKSIFLPALGAE